MTDNTDKALDIVRNTMKRLNETRCFRSGRMDESLLYELHGAVALYLAALDLHNHMSLNVPESTPEKLANEIIRDVAEARGTGPMADRAKLRPANYDNLPERVRWQIDADLDILDWDGDQAK